MRIALSVLALVAGLVGGWAAVGPAPEPPPAPPPEPVVVVNERVALRHLPDDCAERRSVLEAERDRLDLAVRSNELTARILEAQRVQREGEVVEWSDDVPAPERRDAFKVALDAALAEVGGASIVELDCSEYPCMVSVLRDEVFEPGSGVSGRGMAPILEALEAKGLKDARAMVQITGGLQVEGGGHQELTTFAFASSHDPNTKKRVAHRAKKQSELARELVSEGAP